MGEMLILSSMTTTVSQWILYMQLGMYSGGPQLAQKLNLLFWFQDQLLHGKGRTHSSLLVPVGEVYHLLLSWEKFPCLGRDSKKPIILDPHLV